MSIKSFESRWAQAPSRVLTWLGNRFIARTGELGMPEDFYCIPADRTVPSPSELERTEVQRHQIGVDYMRRELLQHTGRLVGAISAWLYIALTAAVMLTAAIVSKPFNAFGFALSILVFFGLGFALLVAAKVWKRNSGSGVTGLRLGRLIPIKEIRSEAVKEAKIVCGRYDAPQALPDGAKIPVDLHDTKGKFFRAADGTSLTSRMLTEDLLGTISPSPAAPLLLVGLPLFAVLVFFATAGMVALPQLQAKAMMSGAFEVATFSALAITGIVAVLGGLSMVGYRVYVASLSRRELISSSIFSAAFIVAWLVALTLAGQPQLAAVVYGPIAGLVAIVIAIMGIISLFAKEDRSKWFKRMGWALAIGVAAASGPFGLFASAAAIGLLPLLYCRGVKSNRTMTLAERNAAYAGEETGPNVMALREARIKQAELAAKDASPFIELGKATGTFASNGDTFGPDEGKPVGLTQNDLSTHIMVLGGTGSGKTSRALRPLLAQVIRNNLRAGAEHRCGLALFDGKGSLPGECRGIPDYLLIEGPQGDAESPPVKLGLIEGLDATTIAHTLRTVFTSGKEQGNSGHFNTQAEKHILMCASLVAALRTVVPEAGITWTVATLNRYTKLVGSPQAMEAVGEWCSRLTNLHPDASKEGSLLSQAIKHCQYDIYGMGDDERGSIMSTVSNWLQPLMSNPKLIEWSMTEEGVDPTICLKGGYVGVSLPEAAYGTAGKAIAALVKARIMKGVKKRGGDSEWRKNEPEATDVVIMVDECQDLINKEDQSLLPVARSLGAKCVYATQNVEGLKAKLGPNDSAALLGQFRSTISFVATEDTLKHVSDEMGVSRRLVSSIQTIIPDFIGTASLVAGRMMFDPRTPGYESMRWLRESGGVSVTSRKHGHVAEWDGQYGEDHKASSGGKSKQLAMPQTYRRWIEDKPVFDRPDWTLLANPTHAVASFNRAGVPRRDVIVTQQVFNMSDVLDLPQKADEEVAEAT